MKELSIEEKVEAYDKVSKEVKDFFEGKRKMCSDITKALEDLFPELKESEDEKIRKWLINEIKAKHHNLDEDNIDFVDKAIAWLEKQGKSQEKVEFYCDKNELMHCLGSMVAYWADRHGCSVYEENDLMDYIKLRMDGVIHLFNPNACPVDLSDCSDEYRNAYYDGYNKCNRDWLKKQGKQKSNPSGVSFEYNGHTWGMCARDGGVDISYDRNLKAFLSSEKSFIYPNDHSQDPTAPESVMEAVKEENVSNGNKLKFKIGDWIVNPKGEALHITDIKDSCYIFNDDESHYWLTCYCDQKCHLWTLEDARDGDVLAASDSSIFIFAGVTYGCCKYHIVLSTDGKILVNEDVKKDRHWETTSGARPATREQSDLLFRIMKKEGYGWNSFDNKVVKL